MATRYSIHYSNIVIKEHIPHLPKSACKLIQKAIEQRLAVDPLAFGKPLRHSYKGHRRLRVSDYRVIYRIAEEAHTVFIVAIGHRKDIYEK